MAEEFRIARVAPDVGAQVLEDTYTYSVPAGVEVDRGCVVLVPFGSRVVPGVVVSSGVETDSALGFEPGRLRPLHSILDLPPLPPDLTDALEFTAAEYLASLGACVPLALPPGLGARVRIVYRRLPGDPLGLTTGQSRALAAIDLAGGEVSEASLRRRQDVPKSSIPALIRAGAIQRVAITTGDREAEQRYLSLGAAESLDHFFATEAPRRHRQAACLSAFRDTPTSSMTASELALSSGASADVIAKLVDAGLLIWTNEYRTPLSTPPRLTRQQADAADAIGSALRCGAAERFLLFGVTGSGKTEVYMRAIAESLASGRQAILIVPEIALTAQVIGLLRSRFGDRVAVLHSALTPGERRRNWRRIAAREAPVVLGPRSAVFAPTPNLGLVIVDEEHESSYKQESTPRYHARLVAERRALSAGAVLVLGSATPSVETFHRARTGGIRLLELTERATRLEMAKVEVVNLRDQYRNGKPAILGAELQRELEATLEAKHQAMLFINRRAYAFSLICRECGFVPMCPQCSVSLTFHRAAKRIRCHHCRYESRAPDTCPGCGGIKTRALGLGTERVEEAAASALPGARIARLDRDVAARKGSIERVLEAFRDGEIDVLVGTQMIAKGLDFPNVTLVGVVAADTGLAVPDYRATERTFQLLTQVAGRAGRHRPGKVLVQTFQPEHPAIRFAAAQSYAEFYAAEIADREAAGYPPFCRLVNVVASSESEGAAQTAIETVADALRASSGVQVLGPADCAIGRLSGRWRKHILVKLTKGVGTAALRVAGGLPLPHGVQLTFDVDPGSLM